MKATNRRRFIKVAGLTGVAGGVLGARMLGQDASGEQAGRMTMDLKCGNIGVSADQRRAIELAGRHGFESVGANGGELATVSAKERDAILGELKEKGLVWGAAGLPVDFRGEESGFQEGLNRLPEIARGLQKAGVGRITTYIMPCHEQLTYLENFRLHTRRLRQVSQMLNHYGLRLGLEYVGTQTLRNRRRFPFLHTMAETRELIAEIGEGNVGLVLDSWHWYTAGESAADILTLGKEEIVAGDLNDAPAGIPVEEQEDGRRELPMATGVIDLAAFMSALKRVGFDGPLRAEPFNQELNRLDDAEACARTAEAMKKAFALIR